jgi:hypothetical protein
LLVVDIVLVSTTACVGFLACTSQVAAFSEKPLGAVASASMRQSPLPLASQK